MKTWVNIGHRFFLNYYQAQKKIQSIADKRSLFATIGTALAMKIAGNMAGM
jgi:hypothetical protein